LFFSAPLTCFFPPQNQLLALDKENNAIQTTIHTNLLVESFYTTSHGSNNNLLSEMNEFTTNNSQSLTMPACDNLLIDGSECTDECNRSTCNCISSDGGANNNDDYGKKIDRETHQTNIMNSLTGDYDERCLENDLQKRCSLENIENGSENYNKCSEDYNNCSEDYNNCTEDYNKCSEDYNNCNEDYNKCSEDYNNCSEDYNNCTEDYPNECQNQYHHQDNDYSHQYDDCGQQQQQQINYVESKGPEILYKSSKELYKAVAKQCGLQCKMTDTCR
jgi:Domain of unknown function (DUF4802)